MVWFWKPPARDDAVASKKNKKNILGRKSKSEHNKQNENNRMDNRNAEVSDIVSGTDVQTTNETSSRDGVTTRPESQPGAFRVGGGSSGHPAEETETGVSSAAAESSPPPNTPPLLEATLVSDAPIADIVANRRRRNLFIGAFVIVAFTIVGMTLGFVLGTNQNDGGGSPGEQNGEGDLAEEQQNGEETIPPSTLSPTAGQSTSTNVPTPGLTVEESSLPQEVSSTRMEIKSNMRETGHVSFASRTRDFAVTWHLPGEAPFLHRRGMLRNRATVAKEQLLFPLVVFSSGGGGKVKDYEAFLKRVAEAGYVVAAIEHTYLDVSVSIDGDNKKTNLWAIGEFFAFPHQNGPKEHLVRTRDVKCLLDLLQSSEDEQLCDRSLTSISDATVDFDDIRNAIDFRNIGYIGHSNGGTAAQTMVSVSSHPNHESFPALKNQAYDDRISAVINYDGGYYIDWARMGRIKKPFLFLASDLGGFWTDNYNLEYKIRGNNSILPDYDGCEVDQNNNEACSSDYGGPLLNVPNPFWNKRKIIEPRVVCRQDGYAVRLKNSQHNSFNTNSFVGTQVYNTSLDITMEFLGKYLQQKSSSQNSAILTEMDPQVGTIYANEQVDTNVCGSIFMSPDEDGDQDGLSNGDEVMLFSTSPELKDTDGDVRCDGWEAIQFKNPALWDKYQNPDPSCFDS